MDKVFALLEHTGAHDPAPVWSLSTTREKAEADMKELNVREESKGSEFEVVEVSLNELLKVWFN